MIKDARHVQRVKNYAAYVAKYAKKVARLKAYGEDVVEETVTEQMPARIELGRWIFDCACGSGVAAHPEWADARCMGCGRIYASVAFPEDRPEIEAVLLRRPAEKNRSWSAVETLADLVAENVNHGIDTPEMLEAVVAREAEKEKGAVKP